jgi:hypothetical protein
VTVTRATAANDVFTATPPILADLLVSLAAFITRHAGYSTVAGSSRPKARPC